MIHFNIFFWFYNGKLNPRQLFHHQRLTIRVWVWLAGGQKKRFAEDHKNWIFVSKCGLKLMWKKLKFDSLVIYMSADWVSMNGERERKREKKGWWRIFGYDSLKLSRAYGFEMRKMILSDDDFFLFFPYFNLNSNENIFTIYKSSSKHASLKLQLCYLPAI